MTTSRYDHFGLVTRGKTVLTGELADHLSSPVGNCHLQQSHCHLPIDPIAEISKFHEFAWLAHSKRISKRIEIPASFIQCNATSPTPGPALSWRGLHFHHGQGPQRKGTTDGPYVGFLSFPQPKSDGTCHHWCCWGPCVCRMIRTCWHLRAQSACEKTIEKSSRKSHSINSINECR